MISTLNSYGSDAKLYELRREEGDLVHYRENLRWTRSYMKAVRLWTKNKGGRIFLVTNIDGFGSRGFLSSSLWMCVLGIRNRMN